MKGSAQIPRRFFVHKQVLLILINGFFEGAADVTKIRIHFFSWVVENLLLFEDNNLIRFLTDVK